MKSLLPYSLSLLLASSLWAGSLAEELSGDLVRLQDDEMVSASDALEGKDVVAVYYSAHWCPPCRHFTPSLSEFYDEASAKYPNFQMVFMSSDRSADEMKEYMEWGDMNFPAVRFDAREDSGLGKHAARGIPYLVVLDADGKQILGKDPGESWKAPQQTMEELKNLLAEG
ncbi:MAG: thioredoxin-like domain-containing protein [Puniceicoccaceae bacterium]